MLIHHFDPVTGKLLGSGLADPSPLEPGVWLVPANATSEPPPSAPPGMAVFREQGSWVIRVSQQPSATAEAATQPEIAALAPRVPMAVIRGRLEARGSWTSFSAALAAQPEVMLRVLTEPGGIAPDDAQVAALIEASGDDPEDILAPP